MKKILVTASLLLVTCFTVSAEGGTPWPTICTVNSNPAYNVFHCRSVGDGSGDICMPDGTGPACADTWIRPY